MDLIVFDLDGTLLDADSTISDYTAETLALLRERGIAYTVATGRARHGAADILAPHGFVLPHVYKNGVMVWRPADLAFTDHQHLDASEVNRILGAADAQGLTPFLSTLEVDGTHGIYHSTPHTKHERDLAAHFASRRFVRMAPLEALPPDAEISSISALGPPGPVSALEALADETPGLVAFSGTALEGDHLRWIDVHHEDGTKGNAVARLRSELGALRIVCFGDSDNDLSMFAIADEAYAPSNALDVVQAAATSIIDHHDEDGVARFLRERFDLRD